MFSKEALEFINEFFGTYGFGRIIDGREYIGLVGGTNNTESEIAIVVFNYLDIEELIRHIENINWEDQHQFSFLLKDRKKAFSQAM